MVESEKNPGRQAPTETEENTPDVPTKRQNLALRSNRSSEMTNYTLVCSPQVIIREVSSARMFAGFVFFLSLLSDWR